MPTWIGLLRAVNVGKRRYPTAELRSCLEAAGFDDVDTHIQSGNIRVTTPTRSRRAVEQRLEKLFGDDRGFDVTTVVLTPRELASLARDIDEVEAEFGAPSKGHYVEVLRTAPSATLIGDLETQPEGQRAVVRGRAVHQLFDVDFHEAKTYPAAVVRAMGASTNRNATVIRALAEKWAAGA